jgi:ParD-like antitoxin of type II ParDE toxin-antitoxin system
MGQPVKVSDALLLDARLMGQVTHRSIAGQIEFWARLGRAMETLLRGDQMLALCKAGQAKPLSACLKSVDSAEGRRRLAQHLNSLPYPHYQPAAGPAGLLLRIEADGSRTSGRFINRKFQPVRSARQ